MTEKPVTTKKEDNHTQHLKRMAMAKKGKCYSCYKPCGKNFRCKKCAEKVKAWAKARYERQPKRSYLAWIGHRTYIPNPPCDIFYTRKEAIKAGWEDPSRVRITLLDKRKIYDE